MKTQFIRKHSDAGKDGRQKENRATEDEMVGWHHQLNGRKFEQTPGDGEGQGSLILKEINPEYSLEGLMLKPKLQYLGHLM